MIDVVMFFKALLLFTAAALIIYAVTPTGIDILLKLLAFAAGSAILTPLVYPHLRGVRKGDTVNVVLSEQELPFNLFYRRSEAVAVGSGRIGSVIRIEFKDGSEEEGRVISYAGMFTPAKVKILNKDIEVV
jgi:hypothetical protein